jgi:2-iminobutanoate/2-iminopropanoate deaminase
VLSGQVAIDRVTGDASTADSAEQTTVILRNIEAILFELGGTMESVAKVSVFMTSIEDFGVMNDAYAAVFGSHGPARRTVEVSQLPLGMNIEIEVWAYMPNSAV